MLNAGLRMLKLNKSPNSLKLIQTKAQEKKLRASEAEVASEAKLNSVKELAEELVDVITTIATNDYLSKPTEIK